MQNLKKKKKKLRKNSNNAHCPEPTAWREHERAEDTSLLIDSFSSCFHVTILTDIWRFVRAIWTVLLPIAAPAFGDTGHLVLTCKLLRAAGLGVVVGFGS